MVTSVAALVLGALIAFCLSNFSGSQIPPPPRLLALKICTVMEGDPRVERQTTNRLRVSSGAKPAGGAHTARVTSHTNIRKRAFHRARRRAELHGSTTYRGRVFTARALQTEPRNPAADDTVLGCSATRVPQPRSDRLPRLAVMTYNCSGMTAELYDVLCDWLQHRCTADIVVLQE